MLESAVKIDDLTSLAQKHNMPAVALTDRNNLFASLEFCLSAKKHQVQPICGILLNIEFASHLDDLNDELGSNAENPQRISKKYLDRSERKNKEDFAEILVIAKDEIGYKNLLKLAGIIYTNNDRKVIEHITLEDLIKYNEGLIVLSAYTQGIIGKLLLAKRNKTAEIFAKKLQNIFGDRFYFEIMRCGYEDDKKIENDYLEIAKKISIPLIATNHVLFSDITMHDAHDVLLCISEGVVREQENRRQVSNQCYFKSTEEMISLFSDLPEALENTVHLAERCSVIANTHDPALPNFTTDGTSEEELIKKLSYEGLEAKLKAKFDLELGAEEIKTNTDKIREEYFQRLDYELGIICTMNFSGYFLIVSDFIKWSKQNNIAVGPGRGSGAGSIIAWVLEITDLDPIKFGLLFERFLNPERVSMPDFDIDFCQERRQEVINYVRQRYGDDRVGQIITFGKMQAKAVIKDVSRVLSLPYAFADYLTELVPFNAVNPVTLSQAIEEVVELNSAYKGKGLYNMYDHEELIQQVLETSLVLEGLHRHASTHAAGIVIANNSMIETVPIYKDSSDSEMLIVQYSMKYCELAGLVKFDFLGLQTLTVITKCLELISRKGISIDINKVGFDDSVTYQMLSKGLGTGVFQFESAGMKNALRKLKPDCIEDIIALGALYRPGPMENIPTYIACKHGLQEIDYLHPSLKEVLQETYGVIIYQEQVMEIARRLGGYSLGSADLLRRAMGKKVKAEMDAQEEIFLSGAAANNIDESQAKSIFATVAKFAGYGFNKSHASAYGVISYQTAFLKANYPAEFLVACLNLDIDNSDKVNISLEEARIFDINITPPCINHSDDLFKIVYLNEIDHKGDKTQSNSQNNKKSIVFSIGAIKNISKIFARSLVEERNKNGPFKNINDFLERIPPKLLNKRLLENLIKSGAFDSLHDNRKSLALSVPKMIAYCHSHHLEQNSNQFSLIALDQISSDIIENSDYYDDSELSINEFEVLGLFLSNHPLREKITTLAKLDIRDSAYLKEELTFGSKQIKLAGVIIKKDSRMSQRGRFITLLLSDPKGIFEVTIFSEEILQQYSKLLNVKTSVIVECDVFRDEGGMRITARAFYDIEEFSNNIWHELKLYPQNTKDLRDIVKILESSLSLENGDSTEKKANAKINIFLKKSDRCFAKIDFGINFFLNLENLNMLENYSSM